MRQCGPLNVTVLFSPDSHAGARAIHMMKLCQNQLEVAIQNMPSHSSVGEFTRRFLTRFVALQLTPEELAVLMAFVILNTSRYLQYLVVLSFAGKSTLTKLAIEQHFNNITLVHSKWR